MARTARNPVAVATPAPAPRPPMTEAEVDAHIIRGLWQRGASVITQLEAFAATFADNPRYALEWSDRAFTAAATQSALITVARVLAYTPRDGEALSVQQRLRAAAAHLTERGLSNAKSSSRSTSGPSNLMSDAAFRAELSLGEDLEREVRFGYAHCVPHPTPEPQHFGSGLPLCAADTASEVLTMIEDLHGGRDPHVERMR